VRRLTALGLGLAMILSMGVQPVFADHTTASAYVHVYHGNTLVATYGVTEQSCPSTYCSINVPVSKRELGRAARWDCQSYPTTVYSGNTSSVGQYCYNPRQTDWSFIFSSTINATHSQDVNITIYLVAAP